MQINGFEKVEAATTKTYEKLPAGGYIVKCLKCTEHDEEKPYLEIVWDIAEGEYKDKFAEDDADGSREWAHRFRQYYSVAAMQMFKQFIECIDRSNKSNLVGEITKGTFDAAHVVGKKFGILLGYKEHETTRGGIAQYSEVRGVRDVETIKAGKFVVPELKPLAKKEAPVEGFKLDTEDLPF